MNLNGIHVRHGPVAPIMTDLSSPMVRDESNPEEKGPGCYVP